MRRVIFTILGLFIIFMSYAQVNVLNIEQLTYRDGLPNNSVQSIKQDKNGFIWFSSFAGLSVRWLYVLRVFAQSRKR